MKSPVQRLTSTAIFIALLVTIQFSLASFGQWVVGPLVNLVLILVAVHLNWRSAILIGFISPFLAFTFGIGTSIFALVPWISLGNVGLVLSIAILRNHLPAFNLKQLGSDLGWFIGLVGAFVVKILIYWIGIVWISLPLLALPAPAAATLTYSFTVMQIFTGLVGIGLFFPINYLLSPLTRRYFK